MATNPAAPLENLRYLDDLQVGERFISATHTLDAAQIKAFASQFDPQPFHLDELAAQDTLFGALAASGWHTAALTMKLLVNGPLRLVNGVITVRAEEHRSQLRNREAAKERLSALLAEATAPPPKTRRPTKPSRRAQARRVEGKRRRGDVKRGRSGRYDD